MEFQELSPWAFSYRMGLHYAVARDKKEQAVSQIEILYYAHQEAYFKHRFSELCSMLAAFPHIHDYSHEFGKN